MLNLRWADCAGDIARHHLAAHCSGERAMQDSMCMPDRAGGQRSPFFVTLEKGGVPILDMLRPKFLELHGTQMWNDLALDELSVALGRLARKSMLSVEPASQVFGNGRGA